MEKLLSVNNEDKNEYKINVTGDPLTNFLFKDYFRLIVVMFFIVGIFPALIGLYDNTIFGVPSNISFNKNVTTYMFSWDEIPGNDKDRFVEFLNLNFGIDWVKTAKIEKIDNNKTIKATSGKNYILLRHNDEKTKVNLKINDGRTDEFIVKTENSKLNIYDIIFIPLSKDYLGQILAILAIAISILTKNLFDKVADVFSSLPKKQIFKIKDTNYIDFLKDFQKNLNDKRIFFVCLLIVPNLTFTLFVFSPFAWLKPISTESMWFNKELFKLSWTYWFAIVYFLWFAISLLAWKVYTIVKYIRRLGKSDLNIQIMHPDRCGGFKSIGDLCLNINMISFAVGVAFASMTYFISLEDQPQLLIYLLLYICASFVFFFYPIMGIHNAMQNQKTDMMNKISMKFESQNLYEGTIDKDGNVDKEVLKKIQDIQEINREITKIPVWPFDNEILWKFVSNTSIPVIAVILKIMGVG